MKSSFWLLVVGILVWGFVMLQAEASQIVVSVRGQVVAVNTVDDPRVMIMRVATEGGPEMIIGAIVPDETEITKEGKPIRLDDLVAGETLVLTYVMTTDGAMARTIIVP